MKVYLFLNKKKIKKINLKIRKLFSLYFNETECEISQEMFIILT